MSSQPQPQRLRRIVIVPQTFAHVLSGATFRVTIDGRALKGLQVLRWHDEGARGSIVLVCEHEAFEPIAPNTEIPEVLAVVHEVSP